MRDHCGPVPGIVVMLIGYNTNIPYKGRVYHVQTEDSGLNNPYIVTLLYHRGAILRSVKTSYADIIERADFKEKLRDLMKRQHREMIRTLITGKCDEEQKEGGRKSMVPAKDKQGPTVVQEKRENTAKAQAKSLDEILLEHISRKVNK